MVTVNNNLDEDIKEFGVYKIVGNRLFPAPQIRCKEDYVHRYWDLHHFIKAQNYKHNRDWYEQNDIKQKLILMTRQMHIHLESPIYALDDNTFFTRYGIKKDLLLFNKKKWIDNEVRKELE